jgi:hypothetical protein
MHLSAHRHLLLLRDKMACISILALGFLGAARLRATCISYILGKAKSHNLQQVAGLGNLDLSGVRGSASV